MEKYVSLILGIVLVVLGVFLLAEFVVEFAKLILGLLAFFVGLFFIGVSRGSAKVIVR